MLYGRVLFFNPAWAYTKLRLYWSVYTILFCLIIYIPVSRFFAFPVNICKKSWYSRLSWTCVFDAEYIFIVEKNETNSSNNPMTFPPLIARISPNLSQVQCGKTKLLLRFSGCSSTLDLTSSRILPKNVCNALLHLPIKFQLHLSDSWLWRMDWVT